MIKLNFGHFSALPQLRWCQFQKGKGYYQEIAQRFILQKSLQGILSRSSQPQTRGRNSIKICLLPARSNFTASVSSLYFPVTKNEFRLKGKIGPKYVMACSGLFQPHASSHHLPMSSILKSCYNLQHHAPLFQSPMSSHLVLICSIF